MKEMKKMKETKESNIFEIENVRIGFNERPYFIADIGSNHERDIERAKDLIHMSAEAGANGVKFQHFLASELVSKEGFQSLGQNIGHQSKWGKSVYEIYEENEYRREWDGELMAEAKKAKVAWLTTVYDFRLGIWRGTWSSKEY